MHYEITRNHIDCFHLCQQLARYSWLLLVNVNWFTKVRSARTAFRSASVNDLRRAVIAHKGTRLHEPTSLASQDNSAEGKGAKSWWRTSCMDKIISPKGLMKEISWAHDLTLLCWRQHKCKGSFATPIATLLHGRIPVNPVRICVALSWSRRCKAHMRLNVVYALCKTVWGRHWNVFTASHWPDEASTVLSLFPGIHNTKTKLSIYNWSGRLQYLSWWCCPFHKLHSHGCHYKRTHTLAYPNLQTAKHLWEALYDFPGALTFEVPPPLPAFPGAWKIQANLVTHVMSCHVMLCPTMSYLLQSRLILSFFLPPTKPDSQDSYFLRQIPTVKALLTGSFGKSDRPSGAAGICCAWGWIAKYLRF